MDDLSEGTGISRSALYKINSDPDYNPSKEVLEKLVDYFQCSFDDLFDRIAKFAFDMTTAFPAGSALSVTVISLLVASNDVTFLQRWYLRYENQGGEGIHKEINNSEKTFIFYLTLGFLKEGMMVFRRLLQDKIAKQLFKKLDADGKKALEALKKESDGNSSLYNTLLRGLRNDVAFHYLPLPYSEALRTIGQKKGHFIVGRTAAETRYLIADDMRSEVLRSYINFDIDGEDEKGKMRRLFALMGNLIDFTNRFLIVYLNHCSAAFEEV